MSQHTSIHTSNHSHTWIHNATDLQTAPWLEQTESPTPARKAHAHAQAHTQTHMQAHMHVHNYASECCCHVIVVIFHHSEHHARQNTRPGKSSSGGHRQAKKAPRPEGPPRRQKPSCRALTVHKWPRPPAQGTHPPSPGPGSKKTRVCRWSFGLQWADIDQRLVLLLGAAT